jgi:hypothetical protein
LGRGPERNQHTELDSLRSALEQEGVDTSRIHWDYSPLGDRVTTLETPYIRNVAARMWLASLAPGSVCLVNSARPGQKTSENLEESLEGHHLSRVPAFGVGAASAEQLGFSGAKLGKLNAMQRKAIVMALAVERLDRGRGSIRKVTYTDDAGEFLYEMGRTLPRRFPGKDLALWGVAHRGDNRFKRCLVGRHDGVTGTWRDARGRAIEGDAQLWAAVQRFEARKVPFKDENPIPERFRRSAAGTT